MRVFFDSSAFFKRFVEEAGSQDINHILQVTSELGLSVICLPEMLSALNKKRRDKLLDDEDYQYLKAAISEDIEDADMINTTPEVLAKVIYLLEHNALRSLDAIHIACALEWQAQLFVSSDKRQVAAAENAGLSVRLIPESLG